MNPDRVQRASEKIKPRQKLKGGEREEGGRKEATAVIFLLLVFLQHFFPSVWMNHLPRGRGPALWCLLCGCDICDPIRAPLSFHSLSLKPKEKNKSKQRSLKGKNKKKDC